MPMGMFSETKVGAQVELTEGGSLRFRMDCHDGCDLIGSGFHERTVVDTARFMDKERRKTTRLLAA
jgi:predicted thioesterase